MNSHRDSYYDLFIGKRVKIWFKDGDILKGNLTYVESDGCYALKNCMDSKRGIIRPFTEFRKTHIRKMEVIKDERL